MRAAIALNACSMLCAGLFAFAGTTNAQQYSTSGFGGSVAQSGQFGTNGTRGGFASGYGSGGMGASSGYGAGGYGQQGFGQQGYGGGNAMGPRFGAGGLGQGAGGQGGFGQNGFGNNGLNNRNFVGRDSQDVRNNNQQMGGALQQFGNQLGQFSSAIENLNDQRKNRRESRDQESTPPPVHVRLIPAGDLAPVGVLVRSELPARLTTIMAREGIAGAKAGLEGRTVILRGVAASDHDRALMEQLARLEPGVTQVRNFLTVVPASAAP